MARAWQQGASFSSTLAAVMAASAIMAGCTGDTGDGVPPATVTDSAGVVISEYAAVDSSLVAFEIDSVPSLNLGGLRENLDEEFNHQNFWLNAITLSDGSVVVGDAVRLKYFTPDGELLHMVGREGDGPGEFRAIVDVCRTTGDSVVVLEVEPARAHIFLATGEHVGTYPMEGSFARGGCLRDGSLAVRDGFFNPYAPGGPSIVAYSRKTADGILISPLGEYPAVPFSMVVRHAVQVLGGDGVVKVADGFEYAVREYSDTGTLLRILRLAIPPQPITDSDWDALLSTFVPLDLVGTQRAAHISMLEQTAHRPPNYPAYGTVLLDPAGGLWIQDYSADPRDPHWTVFSAAHNQLGRVIVPDGIGEVVGFASDDRIILKYRDEDGAVHLNFHALQRP